MLLDQDVAGRDASVSFFSLHRSSVLNKYARYRIGVIRDAVPIYVLPKIGQLSPVPFAEPAWLSPGYVSPYYDDSHRALQKEMRFFFDHHITAEAREREETHERPSARVSELMGSDRWQLNRMRLGPGKHLYGHVLPGNVDPKKFDYFVSSLSTSFRIRLPI